ncbi:MULTISPECIES: orotidine-5'-phosphate decarboxylase [unclassified Gemella]|uniref:orotidine-5'-phosphate decarboxylase n=1 Tax=unclassified Gemella TaxID=2624949 RepID=UPI001074422A|nr:MULTISPECIES: orotidine-5'-phosphate decarboxylase [unclassified Gemella]MBF0710436.1 orotidine-5'-phosphate decarboxylase [Gemella sp. GL1.1]MBF0747074.1 orotidine-5'-phosphate decarboxylase [Gemella sp. 19428wG2_WT2a]NYS27780.1 orotidine-5'-phosphate decarboxylase [Gemella sp. GL1]TFU58565.1 orotidine-5'-phosphate decarboxylase [Gemella sp. WT2a]
MKRDVIVALDFPTLEETLEFLDKFDDVKPFVKVGMELYLQNGPKVIEEIKKRDHKIFLDLKLHDIPNTVYGACRGLARFSIDILTVHAAGGVEMLKAAKKGMIDGGHEKTAVIAVTQLTSTSEENMKKEQLLVVSLEESVLNYAKLSEEAGLDGVVSSVHEVEKINKVSRTNFLKVTPGIRFDSDDLGDQKRVATPSEARKLGSTHIVVGRPITKAKDPVEAYKLFLDEFIK